MAISLVCYLAWSFFAGNKSQSPSSLDVYFCDTEEVSGEHFINNEHLFAGGFFQSSEQAYSGSHSIKLDSGFQYGLDFELNSPQPGDRYKVSVRQFRTAKPGGQIVISAGKDFYHNQKIPDPANDNGWELLQTTINIPLKPKIEALKFYVFKPRDNPAVYFDDFKIERLNQSQANIAPDSVFNPLVLKVDVEQTEFKKLSSKRLDALRKGFLITEEDDWARGFINTPKSEVPINLRLKGDISDHFKHDKWSFRIKVKAPNSWNRLITFSVQNPPTRDLLSEWVFHEFLEREDILCPRYDFIQFYLNNEYKGIFAYEEHFDKQLVEFRNRREGPIIKFDEDVFWLNALREQQQFGKTILNERVIKPAETADISPFKENKTASSSTLSGQFGIAQTLVQQYKLGNKPISEVFDIQKMADFIAIVDITEAFHALVWHNQRFYYNPVIAKLEPIGFDGFGAGMDKWIGNRLFYGYQTSNPREPMDAIHQSLCLDKGFMEKYISSLEKLTRPDYIDDFLLDIEFDYKSRLKFLQTEFTDYTFDASYIERQAKKIRITLFPFEDHSLRVKLERKTKDSTYVQLQNFHCLPIRVIGTGNSRTKISWKMDKPVWMHSHVETTVPFSYPLSYPGDAKFIFFELPGIDSVFTSSVSRFGPIATNSPPQELNANSNFSSLPFLEVNGNLIAFKKGPIEVRETIVIPEGYEVYFKAGTKIDILDGAGFISYSPVFINGTSEEPVLIQSSDKSASGFTVLQAFGLSKLSYAIFENLNTLNYKSWHLTGAVTFYESDVEINNSGFYRNHCEDALNIIRSDFLIKDSQIQDTPFDAFDADFCRGEIENMTFTNIGNDGMDFSGSFVLINNASVHNAGDKGISVGEQADVKCKDCRIDKALTGVASKDLSKITINGLKLNNCQQGLTAYQKKPEFGGGYLEVWRLETSKVKRLYLLESGSKIMIQGKMVDPN